MNLMALFYSLLVKLLLMDKDQYGPLRDLAETSGMTLQEVTCMLLEEALEQRESFKALYKLWHTLTPREQQVVALAYQGMTNNQIAEAMYLSLGTVKHHLGCALHKLNTRTKKELCHWLNECDFSPSFPGHDTLFYRE